MVKHCLHDCDCFIIYRISSLHEIILIDEPVRKQDDGLVLAFLFLTRRSLGFFLFYPPSDITELLPVEVRQVLPMRICCKLLTIVLNGLGQLEQISAVYLMKIFYG